MMKQRLCRLMFVCCGSVGALPLFAQQALRDSLAVATERLSFYPDSVDLILRKASWNMQLEQWEYAKADYDRVLHFQPGNIAARYYRAYANERMGRYNFARLDYENVLKVVPGNFEAQLGLALLNQKDRHYTEAIDGVNRLITQYPDSAVAYAARAGIERERGMYALAEYDYEEAFRRMGDDVDTDLLLAYSDVLICLGKGRKAYRQLDRLVASGVPRASLRDYYKRAKGSQK